MQSVSNENILIFLKRLHRNATPTFYRTFYFFRLPLCRIIKKIIALATIKFREIRNAFRADAVTFRELLICDTWIFMKLIVKRIVLIIVLINAIAKRIVLINII